MAYEEKLSTISLDADSSIAVKTGVPGTDGSATPNYGKQYCFVKVTGKHQAGLATAAANEIVIGVLQNKPQRVGEAATIARGGVSRVILGAALADGVAVKANATGQAVAATPGTDIVLGVLSIGGASGSVGSVILRTY